MRKKILFYTMIMNKGGAEQVIANLVNHFIEKYDITLVVNICLESEYALHSNIKYMQIDTENKKDEPIGKKVITKLSQKRTHVLKKILEEEKPDVMISFLPEPTIRMLSLKRYFPNLPMIVAVRNHPKREFNSFILKYIRDRYYKKADAILVQDKAYQSYLNKNIQDRIHVIPNFLSKEFEQYQKQAQEEDKIVTVTRLEKQKNLPLLIRSFHALSSSFASYKLYVYGTGSQKEKLQRLIHKLHLENRVILAGRVKEIPPLIESASLFVLPSNYEGMPNVLLEAMSLSLPVITTDSTEVVSTIITNYQNGIIVPKQNEQKLTQAMEEVLRSKQLRNHLGKEASKVKNIYNKENIIALWQDVFELYL